LIYRTIELRGLSMRKEAIEKHIKEVILKVIEQQREEAQNI
jgi:hypothetical protein